VRHVFLHWKTLGRFAVAARFKGKSAVTSNPIPKLLEMNLKLEAISAGETEGVRWWDRDLCPPVLKQADALFQDELTVREVAATLRISKTEAGRLRLRALDERMLVNGIADGCPKHGEPSTTRSRPNGKHPLPSPIQD
jgi:hypothetical protein